MRGIRISRLAWIGFVLNLLVGIFFHAAAYSPVQEAPFPVDDALSRAMPFIWGGIALQAFSLALLWMNVPGAIVAACVGGIVLFPFGLLFIEGCMLTFYRAKFVALGEGEPTPEQEGALYPNMAPENSPYAGAGAAFCGLFLYLLGVLGTLGVCIFVVGVIFALRSWRLRGKPVLGLYRAYFTVTPNVWSDVYAIPYKRVKRHVIGKKRIRLVVEDAKGGEHAFAIALRQIAPMRRKEAATQFGARLAVDADMLAKRVPPPVGE